MNKISLNESEIIEETNNILKRLKAGLISSTLSLPLIMFYLYYTETLPLIALLVVGFTSILIHPFSIKLIEKVFNQNKYIIEIEKLSDTKYQFTSITNILTNPKRETIELNRKEFKLVNTNSKRLKLNLQDKNGVLYVLTSEMIAFLKNEPTPKVNLDRKSVFEEIK